MKFWTHDWSIHPEKKHLAFRKGHFLLGQKQIWASSADLFLCLLPSCHFSLHYEKEDDHLWRSREKTRRDLLYITDPGTPLLSTLRLVPHLCQTIKSNDMQGRDKGEKKDISLEEAGQAWVGRVRWCVHMWGRKISRMNQASLAHTDSFLPDTQERGPQWQVQCGPTPSHRWLVQVDIYPGLGQSALFPKNDSATKKSIRQSYMVALTLRCVCLRNIWGRPSHILCTWSAVRKDETNTLRETKTWRENIGCIRVPACEALVFQQFYCLTLPSISLH